MVKVSVKVSVFLPLDFLLWKCTIIKTEKFLEKSLTKLQAMRYIFRPMPTAGSVINWKLKPPCGLLSYVFTQSKWLASWLTLQPHTQTPLKKELFRLIILWIIQILLTTWCHVTQRRSAACGKSRRRGRERGLTWGGIRAQGLSGWWSSGGERSDASWALSGATSPGLRR